MSIWIRSQAKKKIQEVCSISITECYQSKKSKVRYVVVHGESKDFDRLFSVGGLGDYSSEEKALKVLDMIQSHIESEPSSCVQTSEDIWEKYNQNVFQMPQDEEVD